MHKVDVEEHLDEALSCPALSSRLREVVEGIAKSEPASETREIMYELVDIVLQMGQRVRSTELRVSCFDLQEEKQRKCTYLPVRKINFSVDFPRGSEHAEHRR
jgi:hypothetical protein